MSSSPPASLCASIDRTSFSIALPAAAEINPLSLHDALPIYTEHTLERERLFALDAVEFRAPVRRIAEVDTTVRAREILRSEEHTSELQSRRDVVCRLLLE